MASSSHLAPGVLRVRFFRLRVVPLVALHAPDLLDHLAAVTLRCARNTARLSAGCLLNEVEHHGLLLGVKPIPCLRKPDAALGAERL